MKKRFLSVFLSVMIAGSCISAIPVYGIESKTIAKTGANIDVINSLNHIEQVEKDNIAVYYDNKGNEVDITTLNNEIDVNEKTIPSSYDLRDYGRSTSVKNQESQGLCWDFASTASMESNILTNPELSAEVGENPVENLDISEGGNAYYIHTNIDEKTSPLYGDYINDPSKGTNGGNPFYTAMGLSAGYGTYDESLMPYEQYNSGYSEDLRFYSDYRLKDYSELSNDVDIVKTKIMENGAVAVHYNCYNSNSYMVDGMEAYYDDGSPIEYTEDASHVVAIVGWDDSFSRDNFNPLMQPKNDGAWLCKNSWGEENCSTAKGYEGYFWMSYDTDIYSLSQFVMESTDEFDNIHQLQATAGDSISADEASNVFTAQKDETLKQISFYTNGGAKVGVEIYKLNEDYTSPVDGELLSSFDAETDFTGIHNFDCPKGINFTQGDTFSVVIINKSQLQLKFRDNSDVETEGVSYYYVEGGGWYDVAYDDVVGYMSIKAYTSNTNGTDSTNLEELIKTAQDIVPGEEIGSEIIEELNSQIAKAQQVAQDTTATQNDVDNAYYLLKNSLNKIANYSFTVSSVEDYYNLYNEIENKKNRNIKKIVVDADLDFQGKAIDPMFTQNEFTGVLDGQNHKMSNFTMTESDSQNPVGMFGSLNNATVKDITFSSCRITASTNACVIAPQSSNSVISNCKITDTTINSQDTASGFLLYSQGDEIVDCSITNTKIYGNFGASLFFESYSDDTSQLTNCVANGNELYSSMMVSDNESSNITVFCENDDYFYRPLIKLDDNSCTIESFIGKIISASSEETNITTTDGKCTLENKNGGITVNLLMENAVNTEYTVLGDIETKELLIDGYNGEDGNMVIPSELFGNKVVGFSPDFFISDETREMIKSIIVTGNIKAIPNETFSYLPSLEKLVLEEGVENINGNAFGGCTSLTSVTLPNSLVKIGEFAFDSCTSLTDLQFGNGLEVIGNNAFSNCMSLVDPILPESLKIIEEYAFNHCGFKGVTIGKNITEIGDNAFGATGMTELDYNSVYIPDFVINGHSGVAKEYAENAGFKFVDIETQDPIRTGELFDYSVFMKGDINLDGMVNVQDATLLNKWVVKDAKLSPIQLSNGLVCDSFDSIDIQNVTDIQKYCTYLIDTLDSSAAG